MRTPPHTVQEAFDLATRVKIHVQIANNFKMEMSKDFNSMDINDISTEETSSHEFEVNEVSWGKKWGKNNNKFRKNNNNQNFSDKTRYNYKQQDSKSGRKWEHKEKDSKISLLHESSNFIPAKFGKLFFKQFDMTMHLKKEKPKKIRQNGCRSKQSHWKRHHWIIWSHQGPHDEGSRNPSKTREHWKLWKLFSLTIKGLWTTKPGQQHCTRKLRSPIHPNR